MAKWQEKTREFFKDSYSTGAFLVYHTIPRPAARILAPVIGITAGPLIVAGIRAHEKLFEWRESKALKDRAAISPEEKNIRHIFGDIAATGMLSPPSLRRGQPGVQLEFTQACIHNLYGPDTSMPLYDAHRTTEHHDRKQGVLDLLGQFAHFAADGAPFPPSFEAPQESIIAVRRHENTLPEIYKAFKGSANMPAPAGTTGPAIPATYREYFADSVMGKGPIAKTQDYVIYQMNEKETARIIEDFALA